MLEKNIMTRFKFIKQTNSTEQHNKPGYVYLVLASGYDGIIPGKFPGVRRCKIGLSVDPNMRLQQLESSQPPCDYKIVKTIFVENMADVEAMVHEDFQDCNVSLKKSREWFDLFPWQYAALLMRFSKYESDYGLVKSSSISINRVMVGGLITVLGVALLVSSMQPQTPTTPATSTNTVKTFIKKGRR